MKVAKEVQKVWQKLFDSQRRIIRAMAKGNHDPGIRQRGQVVVALVQGQLVRTITDILQCSKSLVYKVAHRFIDAGCSLSADDLVVTAGCQATERVLDEESQSRNPSTPPNWSRPI